MLDNTTATMPTHKLGQHYSREGYAVATAPTGRATARATAEKLRAEGTRAAFIPDNHGNWIVVTRAKDGTGRKSNAGTAFDYDSQAVSCEGFEGNVSQARAFVTLLKAAIREAELVAESQ